MGERPGPPASLSGLRWEGRVKSWESGDLHISIVRICSWNHDSLEEIKGWGRGHYRKWVALHALGFQGSHIFSWKTNTSKRTNTSKFSLDFTLIEIRFI